ncbi:hypothetical protein BAY06_04795 [Elizabethkingia anophelis]|uniref:adenylate/guanylate cyclase domain-containing protein n=1 Tax=Elizabethkingia anophelis TaxID=1117645 RepID=UPI000999B1D5|nr:adenylate/guanylate cyclase domain-containing protein [Elizabethkingia anophelis]OPC51643.1 hypothetical protein BAY06_04795 [Elizabethkingia anophelis]
MANLDLIRKLNEKYNKYSPISKETRFFALNESFNSEKIEKSLPNVLADLGISYTQYFDFGVAADVALLYIDVCSFSTRFGHLVGEDIANYFHKYYDIVIPIIYKYGGEIDKIMGDGIICVFGPPYLENDLTECIEKASQCAKEIIRATIGGKFSSKIAFHVGTINYFKNKTGLYKEFTMIGKPLTEIFRLESVSFDERINYYGETRIRNFFQKRIIAPRAIETFNNIEWVHYSHRLPDLKGVDFTTFYTIMHNK